MSDDEMEKFEITDYDLDNEFNMNRPYKRLSKNQATYGNVINCMQSISNIIPLKRLLPVSLCYSMSTIKICTSDDPFKILILAFKSRNHTYWLFYHFIAFFGL